MTSEKFESLRCTALRMTLGGKGTFSDNIYAKVNRMIGGFLRRNVKIACTKITELTSPGRKAMAPVPAAKPSHQSRPQSHGTSPSRKAISPVPAAKPWHQSRPQSHGTSPGRKAMAPVPAAKPWHVPSLSMIYKYSVGTLLCSLLFVLVTRTT